jgi:hypothetical protein
VQLQVVNTTLESKDKRQPSARLQEKIRNCVSVFRALNETVNEVIEIDRNWQIRRFYSKGNRSIHSCRDDKVRTFGVYRHPLSTCRTKDEA